MQYKGTTTQEQAVIASLMARVTNLWDNLIKLMEMQMVSSDI